MKIVLHQMQAVAQLANGKLLNGASPSGVAAASFSDALQRSLARVSAMQESAHLKAQAFELGDPSVSLNDVMIDMQKANISFQMAVQVRNRLVAAYQEIANMPV